MGATPHVTIVLLSSRCHAFNKWKAGNMGFKRKSLSDLAALIECTKARLENIANATKEVQAYKLEVQLRLFIEQMKYQRERDQTVA